MTDRNEFTKAVKLAAWKEAKGHCQKCGAKLFYGKYHFHHIKECAFGGSNELENCLVICIACHGKITGSQAAVIAKTNRVRNKHLGIRTWRKPMPFGKNDWRKKRIDGTIINRKTGEPI